MRLKNLKKVPLFFMLASSCVSHTPTNKQIIDQYQDAVSKASEISRQKPIQEISLKRGIENFKHFYKEFSAPRINEFLSGLYHKDAFFRDGIRAVQGEAQMKEYFTKSISDIHFCGFQIADVSINGPHVYFRWLMSFQNKPTDELKQFTGMSHVIFNEDGLILFHQDYWDFSELLQEQPLIGSLIRWIKSSLS